MHINVVDSATPRSVRLFQTTKLARRPQHAIGSSGVGASSKTRPDVFVVAGVDVLLLSVLDVLVVLLLSRSQSGHTLTNLRNIHLSLIHI